MRNCTGCGKFMYGQDICMHCGCLPKFNRHTEEGDRDPEQQDREETTSEPRSCSMCSGLLCRDTPTNPRK